VHKPGIDFLGCSHCSRFFWENFPQLKYKNPHVDFSRSGKKSLAEELLVKFGKLQCKCPWLLLAN